MSDDVSRLRAKRGGHRGIVTKYSKEAVGLIEDESETKIRRLKTIKDSLQTRLAIIVKLDEDILEVCDTKDIENEMEESDTVNTRVSETIEACERFLESVTSKTAVSTNKPSKSDTLTDQDTSFRENTTPYDAHSNKDLSSDETTKSSQSEQNSASETNVKKGDGVGVTRPVDTGHYSSIAPRIKLPKLVLPRFKGDITMFQSFWDSFQSAVNNNPSLSKIDKFNYLKSLLDGPAARSIQGLTLSSANYDTALEILQDRFGKAQHIIAAHMDDLLKLTPCLDNKPHHLRVIYDKIFASVRGLEALGIMSSQYSSFLIPVVMSKLPPEVRLQAARMTAKDVWEAEELLAIIKREVEAREINEAIRTTEIKQPDVPKRPQPPTAAALLTADKTLKCIYCKNEHFSASCEVVRDVAARADILKKEGRCFLCFGKGHRAAQCVVSRRCRHCKRKHHQSLCQGNNDKPGTVAQTDVNETTSGLANPSNVVPSQVMSRVLLQPMPVPQIFPTLYLLEFCLMEVVNVHTSQRD